MARKKSKIIKYRKPWNLNVGIIIFTFIFVYLAACLFVYMSKEKVSIYEVSKGSLTDYADYDALIKHVHTLKGTTGNLSITPLFEKYNEILGLLRDGNPAPAKAIMAKLLPVQEKIVDCIVKHK